MTEDLMKVSRIVAKVLGEDPRARDDDKWLIVRVLREMGFKIYVEYGEMPNMPSWETITRCRRKYQELGQFKASAACQRNRKQREDDVKEAMETWTEDEDINSFDRRG